MGGVRQNAFMIGNCRDFVIASSTLLLQRVFRGYHPTLLVHYGAFKRPDKQSELLPQAAGRCEPRFAASKGPRRWTNQLLLNTEVVGVPPPTRAPK